MKKFIGVLCVLFVAALMLALPVSAPAADDTIKIAATQPCRELLRILANVTWTAQPMP